MGTEHLGPVTPTYQKMEELEARCQALEADIAALRVWLKEALDALDEYAVGIPGQLACEVEGRAALAADHPGERMLAVVEAARELKASKDPDYKGPLHFHKAFWANLIALFQALDALEGSDAQ